MIVNVRGTSGSGKSTLVRQVMALYTGSRMVRRIEGRKQPYGYGCTREDGGKPLYVPGHYETPCGGCDTITNLDEVFATVREAHGAGADVLFEGLIVTGETSRVIALHEAGIPLTVIFLSTPLELCLSSINQRRWAKDPTKPPVNPKNTESKFRMNVNLYPKFRDRGMHVAWVDRQGALEIVRRELSI